MIKVWLQTSNRKPARLQRFAVPCMLRKSLVIPWNSQVNSGKPLGEIKSRATNNGMREHYRSILSLNFS
jgi:hypothetical protein